MTEKLFQLDAYARDFTTRIAAVDPDARGVVLERTAFYPGGGGQPCDLGKLVKLQALPANELPLDVVKVGYVGADIAHQVQGPVPAVGDEVSGSLDWSRRYALMRAHTAMHILCGVVWRDYGAQVTGGNMHPLRGRLDFDFESLHAELIAEIEAKLNVEVDAAREVRVRILPREEAFEIPDLIRTKVNLLPESLREIRTVEIVGLDLQADGGTHVANTREVGKMRVAGYKSKGRINKRIEVALEDAPPP